MKLLISRISEFQELFELNSVFSAIFPVKVFFAMILGISEGFTKFLQLSIYRIERYKIVAKLESSPHIFNATLTAPQAHQFHCNINNKSSASNTCNSFLEWVHLFILR